MRRNQSSGASGQLGPRFRRVWGWPQQAGFFSFGGSRNVENSQVYRHLHRLPFSDTLKIINNLLK